MPHATIHLELKSQALGVGQLEHSVHYLQHFPPSFPLFTFLQETLHMTSEGSGEMFEGDFANTCANKFLLM